MAATGAFVGVTSGFAVFVMNIAARTLHSTLFNLRSGAAVSTSSAVEPLRALLVPTIGGLLLAALTFAFARWRSRQIIDPIEANALHGGRMSLTDSLVLAIQNLVSNGFGASVGLEAGYTQVCSGMGSRIGSWLHVRRSDLRLLVGCGAAGAIAAAFNAPLAGTFYAFELIIGTYSIAALVPVVASALAATLVMRNLIVGTYGVDVAMTLPMPESGYSHAILIGGASAAAGVALMYAVTAVEQVFARLRVPMSVRLALGGLAVGALALVSPQVLSAGHGALHMDLVSKSTMHQIALVFALKAIASALSIGSGFRGGLFFASLFLGALGGTLYGSFATIIDPANAVSPHVAAIIGMAALAVAIVGGPMTMTMLVLEMTGDFPVTVAALVAACVASLIVRKTFGYSFATWRFHLRGETIRSAHDVGWVHQLTVDRLMRQDVRLVSADMTVAEFCNVFPLGSQQRAIVVDKNDRYCGIVPVAEVHALDEADATIGSFARHAGDMLVPQLNVKNAVETFERTEADALVVVDNLQDRHVRGVLTEAYALRRYSEELDQRRREISGEI